MSEQNLFNANVVPPTLIDPELQKSYDLAQEYQRELDLNPDVSLKRQSEIIQALDASWPRMGQTVTLYGNIKSHSVDTRQEETSTGDYNTLLLADTNDDGSTKMSSYYVNGVTAVSHGYYYEKVPFTLDNGTLIGGTRNIIKLFFKRHVSVHLPDNNEPQSCVLSTLASVDEINVEAQQNSAAKDRQIAWEYFTSEMRVIHDSVVIYDDLPDRLLALQGYEFDCPDYVGVDELNAFANHLNRVLRCKEDRDGELPYLITLNPEAVFYHAENRTNVIKISEAKRMNYLMVIKNGLVTYKVDTENDASTCTTVMDRAILEPYIDVELLGSTGDNDSIPLSLRLRDVAKIASIRKFQAARDYDKWFDKPEA